MAYFLVECKCGHVGRDYYIPITFGVWAESGTEASEKARHFGRVKHDHKDAILSCHKCDEATYLEVQSRNSLDPYLQCKSRHEQNEIIDSIKHRLVPDPHKAELQKPKSKGPNYQYQYMKYSIPDYEEYDYDVDLDDDSWVC